MENPTQQIREVLRLIVSPPSADVQEAAVKKYFMRNAGFDHPLFHVEPGPSSRSTILGVYQWLLTVASRVDIDFKSVVHERGNSVLVVESALGVHFRLWPFEPVPCNVTSHITLRKEKGLFYISMQKDLCQLDDLAALVCPPISPAVKWLRYGSAVALTIGAKSAQVFGLWRPSDAVAPIETEQAASEDNDTEMDPRGKKKQRKEDQKESKSELSRGRDDQPTGRRSEESLGSEHGSESTGGNGKRKRKQAGQRGDRNPHIKQID